MENQKPQSPQSPPPPPPPPPPGRELGQPPITSPKPSKPIQIPKN